MPILLILLVLALAAAAGALVWIAVLLNQRGVADPSTLISTTERVMQRFDSAAATAIEVSTALIQAAASVAADLKTATDLQGAQFGRVDVLLAELKDLIKTVGATGHRIEAEGERVADQLGRQAAAADALAEDEGAAPGEAADAGAQTPPAKKPSRKRTRR